MKKHWISKSKFPFHRKSSLSDLSPNIMFNRAWQNYSCNTQTIDTTGAMNRFVVHEKDVVRNQTLDSLKKLALSGGFVKKTIEAGYPEYSTNMPVHSDLKEAILPIVNKIKENYPPVIIAVEKKGI